MIVMHRLQQYWPWLVSVGLHVLLLATFFIGWSEAKLTVVQPPAIRAVVVEKPKAAPQPVAKSQPKPQPKPKAPPPKPKPAPVKTPVVKPQSKPEAVKTPPKPAAKPLPQFEQIDLAAEIAKEDIARIEQQQKAQEAAKDAEASAADALEQNSETQEAVAIIQAALAAKWRRPPSARNGMETLLKIRLMPGGEVISVAVLTSSGDKAFDQSAVTAVQNASPLPVPSGELFSQFRDFNLLFRPEDLRL